MHSSGLAAVEHAHLWQTYCRVPQKPSEKIATTFRMSVRLDETSVGLEFPETDAEVVLHCNSEIPSQLDVYYLVDDVLCSVRVIRQNGCTVIAEPFDIPIGKCAVVRDPFGTTLCMLDMSKGPRQPHAD